MPCQMFSLRLPGRVEPKRTLCRHYKRTTLPQPSHLKPSHLLLLCLRLSACPHPCATRPSGICRLCIFSCCFLVRKLTATTKRKTAALHTSLQPGKLLKLSDARFASCSEPTSPASTDNVRHWQFWCHVPSCLYTSNIEWLSDSKDGGTSHRLSNTGSFPFCAFWLRQFGSSARCRSMPVPHLNI